VSPYRIRCRIVRFILGFERLPGICVLEQRCQFPGPLRAQSPIKGYQTLSLRTSDGCARRSGIRGVRHSHWIRAPMQCKRRLSRMNCWSHHKRYYALVAAALAAGSSVHFESGPERATAPYDFDGRCEHAGALRVYSSPSRPRAPCRSSHSPDAPDRVGLDGRESYRELRLEPLCCSSTAKPRNCSA
jgi:hypothetical protein